MAKKLVLILTAFTIFIGILFWINQKHGPSSSVELKIGNTIIQAELADTPEKRIRGLSGRENLGDDQGLLFVFEESGYHGIWMKDMKFPIDILWTRPVRSLARDEVASPEDLGEATSNGMGDLEIVDIAENVSPDTYPQVFRPKEPALYVLEINTGLVEKYKIRVDDVISF